MAELEIRPLDPSTWDAFASLVAKHNGIFGGCWCTWFHRGMCDGLGESYEGNRDAKERLVRAGQAHAALVFDGDAAVGWAEYGTPDELPTPTTARSTTPPATRRPTTASPASSWTATTPVAVSSRWRCRVRST